MRSRQFFALTAFVLVACCNRDPKPIGEIYRMDNIVRVLKNNNSFTLYRQNPQSTDLEEKTLRTSPFDECAKPNLKTDVPATDAMWAEYHCPTKYDCCLITLHLHDAKEINGGTWNHGKFGTGPIQVIE